MEICESGTTWKISNKLRRSCLELDAPLVKEATDLKSYSLSKPHGFLGQKCTVLILMQKVFER